VKNKTTIVGILAILFLSQSFAFAASTNNILSKGTEAAQDGLGRISKALGNKADNIDTFFKGMTKQAAEEITEKADGVDEK